MKICVIGQGYIGLPTAILFAQNDCEVIGVDINKKIIESLNKNILPIEEEGLQELLNEVLTTKKYKAKTTPENADAFIITVPTPYIKENYSCDLSYVISACNSILPYVTKGNVIIIESTIAPLSIKNVIKPLFENNGYTIGSDIFLAHCPERVLPGNLIFELINNNRIIGGCTPSCSDKAAEIYGLFVKGNIINTSSEVAEMSKCMENTFRDVNIALANELVKICDSVGIDALDVIKIANQHPRVNIHNPGPGVGGHCLAIDPYFIHAIAPNESKLIKLARDINRSMPDFVVDHVEKILEKNDNKIISIFGIAYKGNSDDDRESPSYEIINKLKNNYTINIYDPHINEKSMKYEKAVTNSSLILILTDHIEFKHLNYEKLIKLMDTPIIFDTKNILEVDQIPKEIEVYNFNNIYKISETL